MKIGIVCYPTFGGSGVVATELGKELADKNKSSMEKLILEKKKNLTGKYLLLIRVKEH